MLQTYNPADYKQKNINNKNLLNWKIIMRKSCNLLDIMQNEKKIKLRHITDDR
jgi:hypothetical protein